MPSVVAPVGSRRSGSVAWPPRTIFHLRTCFDGVAPPRTTRVDRCEALDRHVASGEVGHSVATTFGSVVVELVVGRTVVVLAGASVVVVLGASVVLDVDVLDVLDVLLVDVELLDVELVDV